MIRTALIYALCLAFVFSPALASAEYNGLDEAMARKLRFATATFEPNLNATTVTWQPETLHFTDEVTGHERWRLTFGNMFKDFIGVEHGLDGVWSGDGSRIGFRHNGSATSSSSQRLPVGRGHGNTGLVSSDGSKVHHPDIYGRCEAGQQWVWAHTERASAYVTANTGTYGDSLYNGDELYKYTFGSNNDASAPNLLLNIADDKKYTLKKNAISGTDEMMYFLGTSDGICDDGPNPLPDARCVVFVAINDTNATVVNYWSIARNATEFVWHKQEWEASAHSGSLWGIGANGIDSLIVQYEGSGSGLAFWELPINGSYADGGPVGDEVELVASKDVNGTFPGNGNTYWGHPVFDKWGTKGVVGHTSDYPRTTETDEEYQWKTRGTHIVEASDNWNSRAGAVANQNSYDGSHHNWNAFSDYVLANQPSGSLIYTTDYRTQDGNATAVISVDRPIIGGSYFALPRPVQSPDGTKFVYHDVMFYAPYDGVENDTNAYNINVAVAYYPHPPEITQVTSNAGTNTIRFDWRLDQASPRGYTHRGWPDEDTDNPPPPRETKEFRLWRSADGSTGWEPVAAVNATIFERYDFATGEWTGTPYWEISDTPGAGAWHYAVTSVEWSGLESRTLSNVYSSAGTQTSAYPVDPKGKSNFCTTFTPEITRYYNIYAADGEAPNATVAMRVASIPATAEKEYLDWLGASDGSTQYLITPVDSQGNEGEPLEGTRTVLETDGQYLLAWTDESGIIPVDPGDPGTPDPTCDINNLNLCNESQCDALGKYWYDGACNANAKPVDPEDPTPDPEPNPTPATSGPILRTGTHLLRVGDSVLRVQ